MLTPVPTVEALDEQFWTDGMAMFNQYVSPWLTMVDDAKYQPTVDRIASLAPTTIVGCHTPLITPERVAQAIATTRSTPTAVVPPQPDQSVLEEIQRAMTDIAA